MNNLEIIKYKKGLLRSNVVIKVNNDFILFELDAEIDRLLLTRISVSEGGENFTEMSLDEINGALFVLNTNIVKLVDDLAKSIDKQIILRLYKNQFWGKRGGFIIWVKH